MDSMVRTTLYAASVLPLKNAELYSLAYGKASVERRQKVDSFRFEKDRCLSLGADMLLRYILHKANIDFNQVCVRTNDFGKPYFEDIDMHFNISHSGDWVICAVSDVEVGCDIETIQPADLQIAQRFFCDEEFLHISRQATDAEQKHLFYRYWTLKESFIKAVGKGLSVPLDSFQIELGEDICIKQSLDHRRYSFTEFSDINGYCCSVCAIGEQPKAALKIVDDFWHS